MEPWPLSHGYQTAAKQKPGAVLPFNGAMASQPWIRRRLYRATPIPRHLQWSHGLSAMDTRRGRRGMRRPTLTFNGAMASQPWIRCPPLSPAPSDRQPSMEPWPLSHGYRPISNPRFVSYSTFNGAMASQPWIPASECRLHACQYSFNGAMASQPWILYQTLR